MARRQTIRGSDTYEELAQDASNAATLTLLHQAGADRITLDQVAGWSEARYIEARAWALEQIEATTQAKAGVLVSVRWPPHVSLAHNGPELAKSIPAKRTKAKSRKRKADA